jgi:dTDP-4-dehydrorhamnose 3,5-epimerase
MKFVPLELEGAYLIELEPHRDERGYFARTWCSDEFAEHGLDTRLAQSSTSHNARAGTLRGLHLQRRPHAETKLVRCTRGAIFDVIVDLRPESSTHASWFGAELSEGRGNAMYVPEGFAHGFQTLTEGADVLYMISVPYAPDASTGVRWDDPAFGIEWPETAERTIGDRDRTWPDYDGAIGF